MHAVFNCCLSNFLCHVRNFAVIVVLRYCSCVQKTLIRRCCKLLVNFPNNKNIDLNDPLLHAACCMRSPVVVVVSSSLWKINRWRGIHCYDAFMAQKTSSGYATSDDSRVRGAVADGTDIDQYLHVNNNSNRYHSCACRVNA